MPRFYLPPEAWDGDAALTGDEAKHLARVLRLKAGDRVVVFDGKGRRADAVVRDIFRDRVGLEIGALLPSAPPRPRIVLAQAIPKGKTMDTIVQKAVELGVAAVQPLVTRNTVVVAGDEKSDKWRRTALEACKQCGQDSLPEIGPPLAFDAWMASQAGLPGLKIIASLASGALPMRQVIEGQSAPSEAIFLVGPEGDFTAEETKLALASGFIPVSLGHTILRVETAALFGLAALTYAIT